MLEKNLIDTAILDKQKNEAANKTIENCISTELLCVRKQILSAKRWLSHWLSIVKFLSQHILRPI